MTLACLKSIASDVRATGSEVIIADNASPAGLTAEIAGLYPDFRLLPQIANLGFAAAANLGSGVARGRYVLFLNPDTVLIDGTLACLVAFVRRNPPAKIWGVRTTFADGTVNATSCRRRPTLWRLLCAATGLDTRFPRSATFSGLGYARLPLAGEVAVDVVCGSCLLIERRLWGRLGGFSPAFFMYGEDDDLCLRAARLGYTCALLSDHSIVHHGSGTEPNQERKLCQILAARSLILRAYLGVPARQLAGPLLLFRPFFGRYFARPELRSLWRSVWSRRGQWQSGRFA